MVPSIVVDISCPTAISASSIEGGELIDTYGTFGVEGTVCGTGTSWNVNLVRTRKTFKSINHFKQASHVDYR